MGRQLDQAVVVITGASSGIGRATARRFRQAGAAVALTARRATALDELVAELAPEALAIPGDVTDPDMHERLAAAAVERFGRIDVWVNNASVVAFGRITEIPADAFGRLIDVNVNGYANGARAALPHLRRSGGALINVASLNGVVPGPSYSPYIASKFAVLGLTLSLRQEWRAEGVDVGAVLPASVDTPLFASAANFAGRRVKALAPANDPDRIARAIVASARSTRRTRPAGIGARSLLYAHRVAPALVERVIAAQAPVNNFDARRPAPPSDGNLHEPSPLPATESGGWSARRTLAPLLAGLGRGDARP